MDPTSIILYDFYGEGHTCFLAGTLLMRDALFDILLLADSGGKFVYNEYNKDEYGSGIMAIDISEAKVERNEIGLWLGWTLATALGMLLGHLPLVPLVDVIDLGIARIVAPLLGGLFVGFSQWLVLRGFFTRCSDWILAGGAGWAAAYAIGLFVVQNLTGSFLIGLVAYLLFGVIVGLLQWPILRREIPNIWAWILANVLGWTLGFFISQIVVGQLFGPDFYNQALVTAISSGTSGFVAGAVTGLALIWIVRQPELEKVE